MKQIKWEKNKKFQKNLLCLLVILFSLLLITNFINTTIFHAEYNKQADYSYEKIQILERKYAWEDNGTAVCTADNLQYNPQIASDAQGGAIITWSDERIGNEDIYAQRINSTGHVQWNPNGTAICLNSFTQQFPAISSDVNGCAYIAWEDFRAGVDIFVQKINSSGHVQWTTNGVSACDFGSSKINPKVCTDGEGGMIVTWQDGRAFPSTEIYAQRINSTGQLHWNPDGIPICTAPDIQVYPYITSDSLGGAIITWDDNRSGDYDIYAQKVNSTGHIQWNGNGTVISATTNDQQNTIICSDNNAGAIIAWHDKRFGSTYDLFMQRVTSDGQVNWTPNGIAICTESGNQYFPSFTPSGAGDVIIAWVDYRNINYDIYAQLINSTGHVQWIANGTPVCTTGFTQYVPEIVSDMAGGAIIVWEEWISIPVDIYAQRLNSTGHLQWDASGVVICSAPAIQRVPAAVTDGSGGAIVAWRDNRSGHQDIYAQRINITLTDAIAPQASNPYPANGSFTNTVQPVISVLLSDPFSGVNVSTINLNVEGIDYNETSPELSTIGTEPLTVNFNPPAPYTHGQTIDLALDADDNAGNNMTTFTWSFTLDLNPPNSSGSSPENDTIINEGTPNIRINITDDLAGVDGSSIIFLVNESPVSPQWDGTTVNWTPPAPYQSGDLINVQIDAKDYANNSLPTASWSFRIDITPPNLISPMVRSAPLELGESQWINVTIFDYSPITIPPLVSINEVNYSLWLWQGEIWSYNWTPSTLGQVNWIIYVNDTWGLCNQTSGSFWVNDTNAPVVLNLNYSESIKLGQTQTIILNLSDFSGISTCLIDIGGTNYTMANNTSTDFYYSWSPSSTGTFFYQIFFNDTIGNWKTQLINFDVLPSNGNGFRLELSDWLIIIIVIVGGVVATALIIRMRRKPVAVASPLIKSISQDFKNEMARRGISKGKLDEIFSRIYTELLGKPQMKVDELAALCALKREHIERILVHLIHEGNIKGVIDENILWIEGD